jgi:serine/threonine-protein kinase
MGFQSVGAATSHAFGETEEVLGSTLDERFRIEKFLGSSNGSEVYSATDLARSQPVVVKLLRPRFLVGEDFGARVRQEFEILRNLEHPNIVKVLGFNQTEHGAAYFVREHLTGASLADLVKKQGPMDVARVAVVLEQMAAALDLAHSMQIIHRDVCPEHFVVSKDERGNDVCKLLNFGLAKVLGELPNSDDHRDAMLSGAAVVHGSPMTVSPEVAAGDAYSHLADVYSLGVVLYYLLVGKMPFESRSNHALIVAHLSQTPPAFAQRESTVWVPESVEAVVMKALSKNPKDRPQSAGELASMFNEAVGRFQSGDEGGLDTRPQVSSRAPTVRAPAARPAPVNINLQSVVPARDPRRQGEFPWLGLVSVAGLIACLFYLLQS